MYDTLAEQYDKLLSRYVTLIERHIHERLTIARDKQSVSEEIIKEIAHLDRLLTSAPKAAELVSDFTQQYKRGVSVDSIIADLKNRYGVNTDEFANHIDRKKEMQVYYATDEGGRITMLASDKRKLLKFIVGYVALQQVKEKKLYSPITDEKNEKVQNPAQFPVTWTGSRNNNNEFVQLVYGLYRAGYLNEGNSEITKIVESLANVLNVSLGKGWQSNLSSSIHKSKRDYEPPIFDKIKQAYSRYADELVNAKRLNK